MQIAYIELDYHSECLNSFCVAFKNKQDNVEIYTLTSIYNDLSYNEYITDFTWILCDEDRSSFLKNNIDAINKNDVVLIGTMEKSITDFSTIKFITPAILRVHSGNFYFNRKNSFCLPDTILGIIDSIYFFLNNVVRKKELKLLDRITKEIKNISFTPEVISDNFKEILKHKQLNLVESIPLEVFEPGYNETKNDTVFTITIPGSVDINKRDYWTVVRALEKIKQQNHSLIEIYLLGKPVSYKGRQIVKMFQSLNSDTITVYTFNEEVPQTEFEKIMMRTNLIWCPVKSIRNVYFYKEQFGITKISGGVSDVIRYGKYGLIPDFYPLPKNLERIITRYTSSDDLAEKLLNLINHNFWLSSEDASSGLNDYTADAVYHKTMKVFKDVVDKRKN